MSALLGGIVFALALWGFVDIMRRIGRGLAAAVFCVRSGVQRAGYGIGAWWTRKAARVAKGRDMRDRGEMRTLMETVALLTNQVANLQAKNDALTSGDDERSVN